VEIASSPGAGLKETPIGFDFSHVDHQSSQNAMWSRIYDTLDRLVALLKTSAYLDDEALGSMWGRSVMYVATEFGRDKVLTEPGTGHHLNNGNVILSPMLKANRVYGGVDTATGLTYGFAPATGAPDPARHMGEGDVYSVVARALDIDFAGRTDFPCMRKA